jgi:hypothetical protein
MLHLKLYEDFNKSFKPDDELKELIKIELENDLNIEDIEFKPLLNNVYTTKLTIDIEWERTNVEDNDEFDRFRTKIMDQIKSKLTLLGRKTNFRISMMSKDEWPKKWIFGYNNNTHTLTVTFYIIFE